MRSLIGSIVNKTATVPVPYVGRGGGGRGFGLSLFSRNDAEQQLRAMGSVGTLFSIVHRTSNATSQVNWRLWRKAESGKKEDRVEVTSHAALVVWNKPNRFFTRQEFVETEQQHVDLTGEGWWVVGRDQRMKSLPVELWPVRPDRMTPVTSPTEYLVGYIYRSPDGEEVPLELQDVIQLRMPNPEDPYRGMGAVQSVLTELDAVRYSAEWNRNFFANSAEPGGIIEVTERLGDDEFQEMVDRWREQHQGVANAHRVAILEQGKWIDRKYTQRDMQFVELRHVSRDVIRESFGIPAFALGDVVDVNRASADASKAWFAEMLTVPRLERFKGALNNDFLPLFGATAEGLEFDYDSPVPANAEQENADRDSKVKAVVDMINAGFDPADTLAMVGLPDVMYGLPGSNPDRDLLVKLVTGAPSLAPIILPMLGFEMPEAPQALPAVPANAWERQVAHLTNVGVPVHRHMRNEDDDEDAAEEVDVAPVQEAWQEALDGLIADYQEVLEAQRDDLADQVAAAMEADDVAALSELATSAESGAALLLAGMTALAALAGEQVVAEALAQGVSLDAVMPDIDVLDAASKVTAGLLASGLAIAAGRYALRVRDPDLSGREVADKVVEYLEDLSDATLRAELGGALTAAQNDARIATLEEGPESALYASEKNDSSTCGPCRDVHGKWLGNSGDMKQVLKTYPFGGYVDCEGGVRCRGTVVAIWRS